MSEKLPMGERPEPKIINASPEEAERMRAIFKNHFGEHIDSLTDAERKLLPRYEIEKSAVDFRTIEIVNRLTNQLLGDVGLPTFDIPPDNVHMYSLKNAKVADIRVRSELVRMVKESKGSFFDPVSAAILVRIDDKNPLTRAAAILHEMIHAKQFAAVSPALPGDKWPFRIAQSGLRKKQEIRKNKEAYVVRFSGLNEAVTSAIERRLYPFLIAEHEQLSSIADFEYDSPAALGDKERVAEQTPFYPDDLITVGKGGDLKDIHSHSYPRLYDAFNFICETIAEKKQVPREVVIHEFIKAHFTGETKEIETLVNETYGLGAFELLGRMRSSGDSVDAAKRTIGRMRTIKSQNSEHKN